MAVLDIQPLIGAGSARFGETCDNVRAILAGLGQTEAVLRNSDTDCFFQNAFQFSTTAM
jgi:hypothetical protein